MVQGGDGGGRGGLELVGEAEVPGVEAVDGGEDCGCAACGCVFRRLRCGEIDVFACVDGRGGDGDALGGEEGDRADEDAVLGACVVGEGLDYRGYALPDYGGEVVDDTVERAFGRQL